VPGPSGEGEEIEEACCSAARSAAEPWKVGTERPRVDVSSSPSTGSCHSGWYSSSVGSARTFLPARESITAGPSALAGPRHREDAERSAASVCGHVRAGVPALSRSHGSEYLPDGDADRGVR